VKTLDFSRNGHAAKHATVKPQKSKGKKQERKAPVRRVLSADNAHKIKLWATVAMGVGIPLLSVGLSYEGGSKLTAGSWGLSALAFGLMVCVLAVSLSAFLMHRDGE
jgi:hypothetical protein